MECELTNMIMIKNPENNCVLVQNRVKYWKGVSFPGGHVEKGESFTESAVREVKEETGWTPQKDSIGYTKEETIEREMKIEAQEV